MRLITIIIFVFSAFCTHIIFAQDSYKTKSGFIYKVGDSLQLGQPIMMSSSPIIATTGEWVSVFSLGGENLRNMNFMNKSAIITAIDTVGKDKLRFKLYRKEFYVKIDEAIDKGEVVISINKKEVDKYDLLKKLKDLYDSGALTEEEFNIEKKKILNKN